MLDHCHHHTQHAIRTCIAVFSSSNQKKASLLHNPAVAHYAPEVCPVMSPWDILAFAGRPDENGEDQPMGPHNPVGLSPCGWPAGVQWDPTVAVPETFIGYIEGKGKGKDKGKGTGKDKGKEGMRMPELCPMLSGAEIRQGRILFAMADIGGKGEGKGKDNQGMGMPEVRPTLSDAEDIGGHGKGNDKGKYNQGKSSQGPYEVEGKGNDTDKGKSGKGNVHAEAQMCGAVHQVYRPEPQEDLFTGILQKDGSYWPGECYADAVQARARALRAFGKGKGGQCVCFDIERRNMYNEKAKFPTRWPPGLCHWC